MKVTYQTLDFSNPSGSPKRLTRKLYFPRDSVICRLVTEPAGPYSGGDFFQFKEVTIGGKPALTQPAAGLRMLMPGAGNTPIHLPVKGGYSLEITSDVPGLTKVQIYLAWRDAGLEEDFSHETFFYVGEFVDIYAIEGMTRFVFQRDYRWDGLSYLVGGEDGTKAWKSARYPHAMEPGIRSGGVFASAGHFPSVALPMRLSCPPEEWRTPFMQEASFASHLSFGKFPVPIFTKAGVAIDGRFGLLNFSLFDFPHTLVTVGEHLTGRI
ncbi:MAG: hypothetical protein KIT79_15370 [Deltaproteobacteria bacterium]|nr:hypothetical protein [Deltaproteobacteria bacterium]